MMEEGQQEIDEQVDPLTLPKDKTIESNTDEIGNTGGHNEGMPGTHNSEILDTEQKKAHKLPQVNIPNLDHPARNN